MTPEREKEIRAEVEAVRQSDYFPLWALAAFDELLADRAELLAMRTAAEAYRKRFAEILAAGNIQTAYEAKIAGCKELLDNVLAGKGLEGT